MGWMYRKLCIWEVGDTAGMVTDDLETFRLDTLETEVVGGTCGAANWSGISKKGSNM